MNKIATTALCFFGLAVTSQAAIRLEVDAGILRNSTGTALVPVGGLLQLVASPSGSAANLTAPTASSFTGGDNIIVAQFSMNYNSGTAGETDNILTGLTLQNTGTPSSTTFDQGDPLELRWYPTLTLGATAPGAGTTYGRFRTDSTVDNGFAWITPADNSTNTLLVLATMNASGSRAESVGFASNVTVVPEPSTVIFTTLMFGAVGVQALRRRSCA